MEKRKYLIVASRFPQDIREGGGMRIQRTLAALKDQSELFPLNPWSQNSLLSNILSAPWALLRLWSRVKKTHGLHILFFYSDLPLNPLSRIDGLFRVVIFIMNRFSAVARKSNHRLVLDVEDLPREQSKALGIRLYISDQSLTRFEQKLFPLFDEIWFTSKPMAEYEQKLLRYSFEDKLKIIPNSAPSFSGVPANPLQGSAKRILYAGTLNPERGVGFLIETIQQMGNGFELHLCGQSGEWILERYGKLSNVRWWDSLREDEASALAKSCDIGIIPHPRQLYLDMTSNSKLAFYVMAGLPFLSPSHTF